MKNNKHLAAALLASQPDAPPTHNAGLFTRCMSSAAERMSSLDTTTIASSSSSAAAAAASSLSAVLAKSVSAAAGGPRAALSSAVSTAHDVAVNHGSSSWIGLFARLILSVFHVISVILYFVLKLATFSLPTLLFTLFSTTLTVTMNATTLYVSSPDHH